MWWSRHCSYPGRADGRSRGVCNCWQRGEGPKRDEDFQHSKKQNFSSRDISFVKGVMRETQRQGVDLVLNSLSGELLHATWKCVAPFGKMIEIGKRDLIDFGKLDMNVFLANRSYCCVDIDSFRDKPSQLQG